MKKNIIICGLIGGFISIIGFMTMSSDMNFDHGMIYGYASMLLAFSLIFVGIKNYRDKYNNGFVSFGKAFKIGFFISLIASTVYVVTWLIDYYYFIPDFMDKYAAHMLEKLKASGASQSEIAAQTKEMDFIKGMYKNPFFNAMFTYLEILPVGLIVSLIAAAILKRKSNPEMKMNPEIL
jgi:ethanolamine transporter EutH